jgi:hypothetical protein
VLTPDPSCRSSAYGSSASGQHEQNSVLDGRERFGVGAKWDTDGRKNEDDKPEISEENSDKHSDSDRTGRAQMGAHCVTFTTSLERSRKCRRWSAVALISVTGANLALRLLATIRGQRPLYRVNLFESTLRRSLAKPTPLTLP